MSSLAQRFELEHVRKRAMRKVGGTQVAVHCHHYNARIIATIEGALGIDGPRVIADSAREAFIPMLEGLRRPTDRVDDLIGLASQLYRYLGFGMLELLDIAKGEVSQSSSHLVEGWRSGFPALHKRVCSFTCGYLEAVASVALGQAAEVREVACMMEGAPRCEFRMSECRARPPSSPVENKEFELPTSMPAVIDSNADTERIHEGMLAMAIVGGQSGLIAALNVYLASMPVAFYNLASIRYVELMAASRRSEVAIRLLRSDSETCGLNTFRGLLRSKEWQELVGDSLITSTDLIVAFSAVCRALGWGNYRVLDHQEGVRLRLAVIGGYESLGYLGIRGRSRRPVCHMLTGIAAGLMELVDGQGPVMDRIGQYAAVEQECTAGGDKSCIIEVRASEQ